jgi:catechol 2,3-dioxygenase-like lactoylglutathione lyase family enzyme
MELTQVRLIVDDFAVCFRWYRDVLEFVPQQSGPEAEVGPDGKLTPRGNGTAGAAVALQAAEQFRESAAWRSADGRRGRALVVLRTDDLDAELAGIRARGGIVLDGPRTVWGRMRVGYLRDPEGNTVELQEWLESRG